METEPAQGSAYASSACSFLAPICAAAFILATVFTGRSEPTGRCPHSSRPLVLIGRHTGRFRHRAPSLSHRSILRPGSESSSLRRLCYRPSRRLHLVRHAVQPLPRSPWRARPRFGCVRALPAHAPPVFPGAGRAGRRRLTTRCSGLATLAAELDMVSQHKGSPASLPMAKPERHPLEPYQRAVRRSVGRAWCSPVRRQRHLISPVTLFHFRVRGALLLAAQLRPVRGRYSLWPHLARLPHLCRHRWRRARGMPVSRSSCSEWRRSAAPRSQFQEPSCVAG